MVQTITFGKFHKVHVCNLKEFKVYAGLTLESLVEILHSGLRNDSEPETFSVKWKANDVVKNPWNCDLSAQLSRRKE